MSYVGAESAGQSVVGMVGMLFYGLQGIFGEERQGTQDQKVIGWGQYVYSNSLE